MAECVRCGDDTAMFLNDVPVCVACYHADRERRQEKKEQQREQENLE
jgi:hypothetical protein